MSKYIMGIESSCDDTGVSIIKDDKEFSHTDTVADADSDADTIASTGAGGAPVGAYYRGA